MHRDREKVSVNNGQVNAWTNLINNQQCLDDCKCLEEDSFIKKFGYKL